MAWSMFAGLAMVGLLSACSTTTTCSGDALLVQPTPGDTTVTVGSHFTAQISVFSCGHKLVDDTFTWSSEDTTVLTVEKTTAVVRAVGVGRTRLIATGSKSGQFGAGIITVR